MIADLPARSSMIRWLFGIVGLGAGAASVLTGGEIRPGLVLFILFGLAALTGIVKTGTA